MAAKRKRPWRLCQGLDVFRWRRSAAPVELVDQLGPDRLDLRLDRQEGRRRTNVPRDCFGIVARITVLGLHEPARGNHVFRAAAQEISGEVLVGPSDREDSAIRSCGETGARITTAK